MKKSFKSIAASGKKCLGTILQLPSEELAEMLGYVGLELIILDMEHCPSSHGRIVSLIRACEAADTLPFVRVPDVGDEDSIKKALDAGAAGILVPNIESLEQAKKAVEYSKFAPIGKRGACPYVRANSFGQENHSEYYEKANRDTTVMLLIEGPGGIAALPDIIKVDGVDVVQIGAVDLSVALGVPGQTAHPEVMKAIRAAGELAAENGKILSFYCDDAAAAESVKDWPGIGIYLLPIPEDVLFKQYSGLVRNIRKLY